MWSQVVQVVIIMYYNIILFCIMHSSISHYIIATEQGQWHCLLKKRPRNFIMTVGSYPNYILKALCNNVASLKKKNLKCMVLHATSGAVNLWCKHEDLICELGYDLPYSVLRYLMLD